MRSPQSTADNGAVGKVKVCKEAAECLFMKYWAKTKGPVYFINENGNYVIKF